MIDDDSTTDSGTSDVSADFETFRETRPDASFSEWLRVRSEPAWTDAVDHRFVHEVAADDISDVTFRRYLVQDYAFVRELAGAFGHAVGEAPTMDARSELVSFLATLTADENDYFERSFDALDVPREAYAEPVLAEPTRAFVDLLGRASAGGYPELLAVLVPAEWVYCSWATDVADADRSRWYLDEWIRLHANPEFRSFVEWLRSALDRVGAAAGARRRNRLAALFERTVDLEVAFFDAAYDVEATDPVANDSVSNDPVANDPEGTDLDATDRPDTDRPTSERSDGGARRW